MTVQRFLVAGLAAALISAAPAQAASTVIDFEGSNYPLNTSISQIFDADGFLRGSVSVTGGINEAWVYDTNPPIGRDSDLEAPFYDASQHSSGNFDPIRPGNALIIQENSSGGPDDNARGGIMSFVFDSPVDVYRLTLLDSSVDRNGVTISAFGAGGSAIGTTTNQFDGDSNGAPNYYEIVELGYFGVVRLDLNFDRVSGAVDNIEISAVPLPAAFWLFGSAILAFGAVTRRRQTR